MNIHPVVELINANGIQALEDRGIKVRWSTVHPEKFSANYDQIKAVESDPIVQECRGLILAQLSGEKGGPGEYEVIAQPFRRFFNLGQGAAAELDWESVRFEEKLDGTLMIVYWYKDQWNVATRSMPDADVPCSDGLTFANKFWRCIQRDDHAAEWYWFMNHPNEDYTLLFEYTAPDNQIVLPYESESLTLLGMMDVLYYEEVDLHPGISPGTTSGIRRPKTYSFNSVDECWAWIHAQPGSKLEGLIAVDKNNKRVKLKNTQYLALSEVMTNAGSDRGIVELLLEGKADDVIPFVSESRAQHIQELSIRLNEWLVCLDYFSVQNKLINPTDRKQAAMAITASKFSSWMAPLMAIWSGKSLDVMTWLQDQKQRSPDKSIPRSLVEKITTQLGASVDPYQLRDTQLTGE